MAVHGYTRSLSLRIIYRNADYSSELLKESKILINQLGMYLITFVPINIRIFSNY